MGGRSSGVLGGLAVALAALVATGQAGAADARKHQGFAPGAPGIGDSYFPLYGNGGYDVRHYGLHIRYDPGTYRLAGRARIRAVATKNLSRFNLDFVGLTIRSLTVDGKDARWRREFDHELVITPKRGLREGHVFEVFVRYAGVPGTFVVPGTPIQTGVVPTDDGAVIWGEPEVAAFWFPVNDHPRDKATYTIKLLVPAELEAISNGRLLGRAPTGRGWTKWTWTERRPMASYLAVAAFGEFDIRRRTTSDGIPVLDAVDPRVGTAADRALSMEERIIHFLERKFGPYPFDALGGIVEFHELQAALETQTRPIYDYRFFGEDGDEIVIVHELAHQWFGDSVAVDQWKHIWLNEGFATYAEWLWGAPRGFGTPRENFRFFCSLPGGDPLWDGAPGNPGVTHLFDFPVYVRGAMTLQALRRAVGRRAFFGILRAWAAAREGRTGSTGQFKALAERISGRQLDGLFKQWLFTPGKPAACRGARSPAAARVIRGRELGPPISRTGPLGWRR